MWAVAGNQCRNNCRRGKHIDGAIPRPPLSFMIAVQCPAQQGIAAHCKDTVLQRHESAVGQVIEVSPVKALRTPLQTLTMENVVHLSGAGPRAQATCLAPFPGKCHCILAAALEAWPVSRRQRRRLIEKKELGIEAPPDVAMPPLEIEHAADPLPRRPAAAGQRPCIRMEPAAAVAHE